MTERSLRVLHYSNVWLEITQTWLHNQIRLLPAWVESHIVCRSIHNLEAFPLPNIHCLKRDSLPWYLWSKAAWAIGFKRYNGYTASVLDRVQPHILHSHFGNSGWMNARLAADRGLPHVVTFYGQDVSMLPKKDPAWKGRYRELFASPKTTFLCEGSHMIRELVALGCPPEKACLHRLGVELDSIRFEHRHWKRGEPLRVLIAGSFREKKGIPYALEALGRMQKTLPMEITVIGDAGSQEEKQRILGVIGQYGMESKVRMLGFKPHAVFFEEAYRHHLFLSPSVTAASGDTEGGAPVSLIEMVATGIPVVSSLHCDIPEVVLQGVTGWLAPERDVEGLVAAIGKWVENLEGWGPMVEAGRRHVEEHYSSTKQADRLAQLYRQLASA
jgi:colanic acid/amylovoran biosynthesis glycosyltransferase